MGHSSYPFFFSLSRFSSSAADLHPSAIAFEGVSSTLENPRAWYFAPTAEQYNELKARRGAAQHSRDGAGGTRHTDGHDAGGHQQLAGADRAAGGDRLRQNEKEFASVTMAESLDAENAELRKAATPGRAMHAPPTPEKAVAMKAVAFYESHRAMSVNGSQVHCSCGGEQRPLEIDPRQWATRTEVLPSDIGFTAKELGDCADRLPDYMQDYLTCARARVPPPPPPSLPSALAQPHPRRRTHPPLAFSTTLPRTRACASTGCKRRCCCRSAAGALRSVRARRGGRARARAPSESSVDGGPIAGSTAASSSPREPPATSLGVAGSSAHPGAHSHVSGVAHRCCAVECVWSTGPSLRRAPPNPTLRE